MPARPNRLKRGLFSTGVVLGLLVFYVASWPFVSFWCERNLRAALPVVRAVYAPLAVYCREELPGSRRYSLYSAQTINELKGHVRGDASGRLHYQTKFQFVGTPLRDVVSCVSELHDIHIELLDDVDDDVEVTANVIAPLGEALDGMLQPLDLAAVPIGRKLVIGRPEAVQQLAAETAAGRMRANRIVLVLVVAVTVLLVRRRAVRRRAVIDADEGN